MSKKPPNPLNDISILTASNRAHCEIPQQPRGIFLFAYEQKNSTKLQQEGNTRSDSARECSALRSDKVTEQADHLATCRASADSPLSPPAVDIRLHFESYMRNDKSQISVFAWYLTGPF
jgi:hypothetical protein